MAGACGISKPFARLSNANDPFAALGDATRRRILELLRDRGGLPAGIIAREFPGISRPAVSKHLAVLRQAGIVSATTHGREVHYAVEAASLRERLEWLERFAPLWEASLAALKQRVEGA